MKRTVLMLLFLTLISKTDAQTSVLTVADNFLEEGNYQRALQKLKAEEKPDIKVLYKIAEIYQKTGNYANAIKYYNKVYALKPSPKVKEQLGKCYQYTGNTEKAIQLQSEVLKANPDNLLLQYHLSKLYAANRKTTKAIYLLVDLVKKDPTNPNYHFELGQAYEKIKKDPTKYYLEAYGLDSAHVKSIYQLSKYYAAVKVRDSSGMFIDKGLAFNANSLNFLQLKAQHVFLEKEYDSTLVYLKKLENQKFITPFVMKLFGLSYYNLKDYENAITYFKKASKLDPKDNSLDYNLGLSYKELDNYRGAYMSFMMSIMKQKTQVDKDYYQLGLLEIKRKSYEKALGYLKKGYENNKRNHLVLFNLAMVSEEYYKDQKIALNYYKDYIYRFEEKDKIKAAYANSRIKEINKELFVKGASQE